MNLIDLWKRRYWRRDSAALAALTGTTPALLITGGSEGIGLALAHAFASPARTTVLIARTGDKLEDARLALASAGHPNTLTFAHDITTPIAPAAIHTFLEQNDLYADLLINSAGIGTTGDFAAEPTERLQAIDDLNIGALTRLCRAVLPDMLTRGQGGIINIASLGGFAPGPYQAAYYASKAYVISLSRALAHETRGQGVRIACVTPGPVDTEWHARAEGTSSLYRHILPAMSPEAVAASTRRGFHLGHGLIIPGVFNTLMALAMRFTPAILVTPIVAILLKPRSPGT